MKSLLQPPFWSILLSTHSFELKTIQGVNDMFVVRENDTDIEQCLLSRDLVRIEGMWSKKP